MTAFLKNKPIVLFDLDGTLFDHRYSLRAGITALQNVFKDAFGNTDINVLVTAYDTALEDAYDAYLRKQITYDEKDIRKFELFFHALGKPKPMQTDIHAFQEIYEQEYLKSRQATSGTLFALSKLRINGHKLYIVTNGEQEDQMKKVNAIGIAPLVDGIFTSQEIAAVKPSHEFFSEVVLRLHATPYKMVLVGNSITSDVEGAVSFGITPILYAPDTSVNELHIQTTRIKVIHHMNDLLDLFRIKERQGGNPEKLLR